MQSPSSENTAARPLAAAATVAAVFAVMALITAAAARDATNQVRILEALDRPFETLRTSNAFLIPWLDSHAVGVAGAVSATIGLLVAAAFMSVRRNATPIAWFGGSVCLVVWGEVCFLDHRIVGGAALFVLGAVTALLLGIWYPLRDRRAIPGSAPGSGMSPTSEYILVGVLTVAAFVTRVYALNEVPSNFENEMILGMFSSRSLAGVFEYAPWGMVSNTNGIAHLFLQLATFEILGTSVFSLRFSSAFWWTLSVPIFYLLLRRISGVRAAVIGCVFLITAPEQLFWSRWESTCLMLLTPVAIITAALSIRLAEGRRGWLLLVAVVLWLPLTRYCYTPVIVLPVLTALIYGHALLFTPASRRGAWRVIPALAVAGGLWIFSLSAAHFLLDYDDGWQFISPVRTGGAPVWQGEGRIHADGIGDLAVKQVTNIVDKLGTVAAGMTYETTFNTWYRRGDTTEHPTMINVAVSVIIVVGIGYLLGQLRDPRAFALLVWMGLGLLPAVMSLDPAARRMGLAFPAFYAIAAVTIAAALRFVETNLGRWLARTVHAVVALGLAVIAWTSLGSHFLLPMKLTYVDEVSRVSKPVFAQSNAVFHTLAPVWSEILALVHGDTIFNGDDTICLRKIGALEFKSVVLRQGCDFEAVIYRFGLWPQQRRALRAAYDPQSLSFLVSDTDADEPNRELLRELFPQAPRTWLRVSGTGFQVLWFQVGRETVEALRMPVLQSSATETGRAQLADNLLADVKLNAVDVAGATGLTVEGGILIDSTGWYTIALEPACEEATLEIDGMRRAGSDPYPLTMGVHHFTLQLSSGSGCVLPFHLKAQRFERTEMVPAIAPMLLAPHVAQLPQAVARPLVRDSGYEPVPLPFDPPPLTLDIGIDREGVLVLLYEDNGTLKVKRVRLDGSEEAAWRVEGDRPSGMSVAPDGTVFLVYNGRVTVYDRRGQVLHTWTDPVFRTYGLGHLANGDVLSPMLEHHEVNVVDRSGRLVRRWREFEGGPGVFREPTAVAVNDNGDILVTQSDRKALWFKSPTDRFDPVFVGSFRIDFSWESVIALGWALDDTGRVIVPQPGSRDTFIYELDGDRVMAVDPRADFQHVVGDELRRVVTIGQSVYTLDAPRRLRRFMHVSDVPKS